MRAPGYGHPVHRELARGTGPCRACLSTFVVGKDERLLFTFNPFSGSAHLAHPGPVFIHVNECQSARSDAYPQGLRGLPVVVEVHYTDGTTSAPRALTDGNEARMLASLLDSAAADCLHLRHAEAGCFIARVDRAEVPMG